MFLFLEQLRPGWHIARTDASALPDGGTTTLAVFRQNNVEGTPSAQRRSQPHTRHNCHTRVSHAVHTQSGHKQAATHYFGLHWSRSAQLTKHRIRQVQMLQGYSQCSELEAGCLGRHILFIEHMCQQHYCRSAAGTCQTSHAHSSTQREAAHLELPILNEVLGAKHAR
jgi:hypothetical protein